MRITVSGGQFFADGFAVRNAFEMKEGQRRLLSYLCEEGCGCATLSLSDGRLVTEKGTVGMIRWKNGTELYPAPLCEERVEEFREFSNGGNPIRVTCLSGRRSAILLSGGVTLRHEAATPFRAPTLSLMEGQQEALLYLRAGTDRGEYVILFSLAETPRVLLERYGDEITCTGNEVTVICNLGDLRARRITERCLWNGQTCDCSREIVCTKDHPLIREEAGRLLLEAVLAEDEEEIRKLLSPSIRDAKAILRFFDKITQVRPVPRGGSPTAIAAVHRKGEELTGVTYDFEFDADGLIENILTDEE